jgi:protein SCO1/2
MAAAARLPHGGARVYVLTMLRLIRAVALCCLALLALLWAFAWATRAPEESLAEAIARRFGTVFGGVPSATSGLGLPQGLSLGGPFTLVDQSGQTVTDQNFAGRWRLVYFGYAFCPDVCPTELGVMAAAVDLLGPQGDQVVPLFITIDPARDTPAALADYVTRFHPRLVGLTGSPEQVADVARKYRVYFAKAENRDMTTYLMDHSSFIYLVGPDGRVRELFRPGTAPETIAAALRRSLDATPPTRRVG